MTIKKKAPTRTQNTSNPRYLWAFGKLIPWEEANVHITSMAWASISAVFEGIRAYWNDKEKELSVFRLDAHIKRLSNSMKLMRMVPPLGENDIENAIAELLTSNKSRENIYIMPFAYFSGSVPGYKSAYQQPAALFITAVPTESKLESNLGISCCISSWTRISDNSMPPRVKGISNYQNSRLVSTEAELNGYDAGIILNSQGKVSESAYGCIFIIRDGVAYTPPTTADILESITRDTIITLLQEDLNIPVQVRDLDRTELYVSNEMFLCGTYAEIDPVISVDRYVIGNGNPGPITEKLMDIYKRLVYGESNLHHEWVSLIHIPD